MKRLSFILLSFCLTLGLHAQKNKSVSPGFIITSEVKTTKEVRNMQAITPTEWQQMVKEWEEKEQKEKERKKKYREKPASYASGKDPVIQDFMPQQKGSNAPLLTFEGNQSAGFPSDANGAVNGNYYVQAVNASFSIFDKSGNKLAGPIALNSLFTGLPGGTYNDGDPIVLYDDQANRWLITEMSKSGSNDYLLMAVSQTDNPLGAWYSYSFDVDDWPDYPKYGIWRDGYYIGIDKLGNNPQDQEDVFAVERSKMLIGQPAKMVGFINPDRPNTTYSIAAPVDNEGDFAPANTPALFVAVNDAQWNAIKDQLWLYEMDVDWNTPFNSTFGLVKVLDVAPFSPAPNPTQPGGYTLDGLGGFIMNKPVYRNFTNHQELVCCHAVEGSSTGTAGMRWYELRKTNGDWEIRQQGTYSPDSDSRWVGSITMNSNHRIVMGYSVTGSSTYPGIRYTAQSPTAYAAANGLFDIAEEVIYNGNQLQSSDTRWGDYTNISVDPSNDTIFWYTNQYVDILPKTKISKFKFGPFSLTADFVVSSTCPHSGDSVRFYDISYGSPTTWNWSFNPNTVTYLGSTSSSSQNPRVRFNNPGTYSVTLSVGDGSTADTLTRTAYIVVDSTCRISSFPWTEDFENGGNIPDCWSQEYVNLYNEDWKFQNGDGYYISSAHSGSYNAYFLKNNARTRLILPPLDLSSLTTPQMEFWYGTSYGYYKFNIVYKSSATSSWVVLKTYQNTTINSWVHDTIVLPDNTSDSRLAFEIVENNGSYGLNIDDVSIRESQVNCAPPLGPQTTAWGDSAQISWLSQPYSPTYDIEYGTSGFSHGNGTLISNVTDTCYTIAPLNNLTSYDWYVRKNCSGTDTSNWTGPIGFTTTTSPYSLPMTEDFENGFVKFGNAAGNGLNFTINTTLQHGGSKSAHNAYADYNVNYLVMNSYVDLSQTSNPFLTFWHIGKIDENGDYGKVQISTDNGSNWVTLPTKHYEGASVNYSSYQRFDESSYSIWGGNPADNTWWKKETYSLEAYKSNKVKVRFLLVANSSGVDEGWYIDDITIEDRLCPGIYPDSLWTQNITATSAELKWRERGSATAWDIEYGNAGFTQGTGVTVSGTNSNPYILSSLTPSTGYDWYVRSSCGGGNYSEWSGPVSFTTPCTPTSLPYFQDFENVATPNLPSCMTLEDANKDGTKWNTENYFGYSGNGALVIGTPANKSSDDWFFTPGFMLQAGVSYEIAFVYSSAGGHESLEVKYGNYPDFSSMNTTPIWYNNDIIDWSFTLGKADITPASTGIYYFGFHANSPIGTGGLYLDDIYVNINSSGATWSGTNDNDWYKAANWNNDTIPTSHTDVVIPPTSTHFPTLNVLSLANNLTLRSDASGNASLLGEEKLKISGDIKVEQYASSGKWHGISSPVDSATTSSFFFNHNPDVWLTEFNESSNSWTYITSLTRHLPLGCGYMFWVQPNHDTTFTFKGNLKSDDVYMDNSQWSDLQLFYSGNGHGFNLVGNPYVSALDWDLPDWDTTNIDGSIWVWNPTTGNYAYRNSQGQGSLTDGIIPRTQAFFIRAISADMYFTIPASARVHSNQAYYKENDDDIPHLIVDVLKGERKDEIWVSFGEDNTEAFDRGKDVYKFGMQDDSPMLWIAHNDEELSILAVPMKNDVERIENLVFSAASEGTHTLKMADCTLPESTKVFLEDTENGNYFDFKKNDTYYFETSSIGADERFKLHFFYEPAGNNLSQKPVSTFVYADEAGRVHIIRGEDSETPFSVSVYDATGREIVHHSYSGKTVNFDISAPKGIYLIKVTDNEHTILKKVFTGK